MPNPKFYPRISDLVTLDAIPQQLGFIRSGLTSILDDIYFKDLQFTKSPRGDAAFYSLSIVSLKRLDFNIPGTEIALILNPSHTNPGDISEFPITVSYEWPILAYLKAFNASSFSFNGTAILDLAIQVLGISERQLIEETLHSFFPDSDILVSITELVNQINAHPDFAGTTLGMPSGLDPIGSLITLIETNLGIPPTAVIFTVVLIDSLNEGNTLDKIDQLFSRIIQPSVGEYIKKLITPKIEASLSLNVGIEFPRNYLLPLTAVGGTPLPDPEKSMLRFIASPNPSFSFSTETGIGYDLNLAVTMTPSRIGNTGFEISFSNAKLDISKEVNIPEADLDGRPSDFIGVYIGDATIKLPDFFNQNHNGTSNAVIKGRNLLIGTGGISGTLGIEAISNVDPNPAVISAKFGSGFELQLNSCSVTFHQNEVIGSDIAGTMLIPGFEDNDGNPAQIDIRVHIDGNGDFNLTASEAQGITAIKIKDILQFTISSISVGRKDNRFYASLSGALDFQVGAPVGQFLPDKIDIQKMVIWDDGKFEFEGGKITLPKALSFQFGPAKLSITGIGLGTHQQQHGAHMREYSYFTFDGGVNVNPGGVDVSGSGIAFYFTTDNGPGRPLDFFMRIQSIKVDIIIPGNATAETAALTLKGFLSMQQATPPSKGTEYVGGVEFTLPKLRMGGSAAMRLNPDVPAFIVDVGLEMSTPILLGATGLGIYGFRALLGLKYVASRQAVQLTDNDPWWQYYKKKVAPDFKEGIQVSKFQQKDGFSLGAGVSLATAPDAGRAFSSKIFFLLSLPEVFMLQGQGQILKQRIGLDVTQDPPFFALISITSTSVETAIGVNYKIPDEGTNQGGIATVDGLLEMGFFWGNAAAWYINIGKDQPENRRIQVKLLSIFNVYFYLMLSSSGIRAGAGASYSLKKKWGPLKAELSAYIDVAGKMSFRPKQLGASIQLGGTVEVSIFGIGFGLSGHASLAAESAKPFMIAGSFKICVKVLWKTFCGKFEFNWTFDSSLNLEEMKLFKPNAAESVKALNMHTEETFALYAGNALPAVSALNTFMIPMDSKIDIEFTKSVKVAASVQNKFGGNGNGSNFIEYFSPQRGKSDRVRHEYILDSVDILYHNGTTWVPYDMYAAATPLQLAPFITTNLSTLKYGNWQNTAPDQFTKLRIMAQSPLDYLSQGTGNTQPEDLGISVETIFCAPDPIAKTCITFDTWRPWDQTPILTPRNQFFFNQKFRFRVVGGDGDVVNRPLSTYQRALRSEINESIELYFIESFPCISLHVRTCSPTALVKYYERVLDPMPAGWNDAPRYSYRLVETRSIVGNGQLLEISYDQLQRPIDKIVIQTGTCKPRKDIGNCLPTLIFEKEILKNFIERLIKMQHIAQQNVNLLDDEYRSYTGVFFETPLYPFDLTGQHTRYTVVEKTPRILKALISDDQHYQCPINFEVDETELGILWENIVSLIAFEIDKEALHNGSNTCFTMLVLVREGKKERKVVIKGCSCHVLYTCGKATEPNFDPVVVTADLLNQLVLEQAIINPRINLSPSTIQTYQTILSGGEKTPSRINSSAEILTPKVSVDVFTDLLQKNELEFVFSESGKVTGTVAFVNDGLSDIFRFDRIRSFKNLQVVKDRSKIDQIHSFTIDAVIPIAGKEQLYPLTGRTSFDIGPPTVANPAAAASNCGDECGNELGPKAALLERYFNTLISNRHLLPVGGAPVNLFPDFNSIYSGVFQNTLLYYQNPPPAGRVIQHVVNSQTPYRVEFSAVDNNDFRCPMWIEVVSPQQSVKITDLISISNLRLDPAYPSNQPVYNFIADAVFRVGKRLINGLIRGASCHQLNACKPRCEVLLYKVCVLSYEDAVYNDTIWTQTQITNEVTTMINAFNGSLQPIWRPYTNYAININTRDILYRENGTSQLASYARTQVFAFRTTGPLGHFHEYIQGGTQVMRPDYAALKSKDRQDEFKLTNLQHYVDFTKSYPNADGQLINAKPLFYVDPKLLLFYLQAYVYEMLHSWGDIAGSDGTDIRFFVDIKDPAPDPASGAIPPTVSTWELSPLPIISQDVQVINTMITYGSPCAVVSIIDPLWVNSEFDLPDLKPLKLYTAIFQISLKMNNAPANAAVTRELLRYGFQTSRYANFEEQVNSYKLKTDSSNVVLKAALFTIKTDADTATENIALQALQNTLAADDALLQKFADPFNRLLDGIFKIPAQHPAVTTEFNVVKNAATGRIYGILVRNPEPFNDPKIPLADLTDTLTMSVNGTAPALYKAIWSKDRSQAFVTNTNNAMNIAPGASIVFTFRYKQFNGQLYVPVTTVSTVSLTMP